MANYGRTPGGRHVIIFDDGDDHLDVWESSSQARLQFYANSSTLLDRAAVEELRNALTCWLMAYRLPDSKENGVCTCTEDADKLCPYCQRLESMQEWAKREEQEGYR